MNINLKESVKIHNRYELELKDARTGEVKQTAIAENVVLDQMWQRLNFSSGSLLMFGGVAMGTGDGTPAASDTALFKQAFSYASASTGSSALFSMLSLNEAYPTSSYVWTITVPAAATYVGELTEIGLMRMHTNSSTTNDLWTHAMLQDAEGNPIVISKTDLDVLTITVTVYVTFGNTDSNFIWAKPGPLNALSSMFRNDGTIGKARNTAYPFTSGRYRVCHCTNIFYDGQCITRITSPAAARLGSSTYNVNTKVLDIPSVRMASGVGNGTYYNGLVVGTTGASYLGGIIYPNADIFPNQTIQGMAVGIGDGAATEFDPPLDYFVEGTDKVYVNGILQQRGVDYTIGNINESLDTNTAMSSFLEPISGIDVVAGPVVNNLATYIKGANVSNLSNPSGSIDGMLYPCNTVPFTNVVNSTSDNRGALLKTHNPFIYRVPDNIPTNLVSDFRLTNLFPTLTYDNGGVSTGYMSIFAYHKLVDGLTDATDIVNYDKPDTYLSVAASYAKVLSGDEKAGRVTEAGLVAGRYCGSGMYASMVGPYNVPGENATAAFEPTLYKINDEPCDVIIRKYTYRSTAYYSASLISPSESAVHAINASGTAVEVSSFSIDGTTYYYTSASTDLKVSGNIWVAPATSSCSKRGADLFGASTLTLSGTNDDPHLDTATWDILSQCTLDTFETYKEHISAGNSYYKLRTIANAGGIKEPACAYKYYKLALDTSGSDFIYLKEAIAVMAQATYEAQASNSYVTQYDIQGSEAAMLYSNGGLVFTTPPAEGAVITMDAAIDRPFKNGNFVIDTAMTLHFGDA